MTKPRSDLLAGPDALSRLAPLLRDPGLLERSPRRDGHLDLLGESLRFTATQRMLDTRATAWLYDRLRESAMRAVGAPHFADEVRHFLETLALGPGGVVLDVACGHGNFTLELARRVGPAGLVIGLDVSRAMLRRADARLRRAGLSNVVLLRADVASTPFVDGAFRAVLCAGGLHQFPDRAAALGELARVLAPGGAFAASTFSEAPADRLRAAKRALARHLSLHFLSLSELAPELEAAGFETPSWRLPTHWFGYLDARRAARPRAPITARSTGS